MQPASYNFPQSHAFLDHLCDRRIEDTWRLWQKFLDDFSRFEDWLKSSEKMAALPNSSGVLYTVAKEELKKFEVQLPVCDGTLARSGYRENWSQPVLFNA